MSISYICVRKYDGGGGGKRGRFIFGTCYSTFEASGLIFAAAIYLDSRSNCSTLSHDSDIEDCKAIIFAVQNFASIYRDISRNLSSVYALDAAIISPGI